MEKLTKRQQKALELSELPRAEAARLMGISERNYRRLLENARKNGAPVYRKASNGQAETTIDNVLEAPDGYKVKGTSSLVGPDGNIKQQWIKTDIDKERQEQIIKETFIKAISKVKPLPRVKSPKKLSKDTLTVYPMGDPHIGLYAWSEEAGEDFDCDIAEKNMRAAVSYLIEKTPNSETAVILNLGDYFHADNQLNRTQRAGNALDVDGRWARVQMIGTQLMIDCINIALTKHKQVVVRNNPGNHDPHTAQALAISLSCAFRDNPRVIIKGIPNPFFFYEFGKNMIVSCHGDMVKPAKMQGVVSNYYPEAWGRTEHRYAFLGHFHHENRTEDNGLITEIFNTLASSDAWHHASGYRSKRNMKALVLDIEDGEVERYTFSLKRESLCS